MRKLYSKKSFVQNVDTKAIDKILEELEKEIDNPNAWIPFDEAMAQIHKEVFDE